MSQSPLVELLPPSQFRDAAWYVALTDIVNRLNAMHLEGFGSPEGVVFAGPGVTYADKSGTAGACLFVKETATTLNTGWAAK